MQTKAGPRVVILGVGFGGLYAARELSRRLRGRPGARITLVDRNNYILFTPMLTEVVAGELGVQDVVTGVRGLPRNVDFLQGRVLEVDLNERRVTVAVGAEEQNIPEATRELRADHLVLALGSVTNYRGIPGLRENSLPMKGVGDAVAAYRRAITLLERASAESDPEARRELLTFVVGGGGFAGVETMAALNDLVRETARKRYPNLEGADLRTLLVHPGGRLLPELDERLARYAQGELEERGVEVMLGAKVTSAGPDHVALSTGAPTGEPGGERVKARFLIWTGGVAPSPVVDGMDVGRGSHGGVAVDGAMRVPGKGGVWALGDCAEIPVPGAAGRSYAPTAQNATREGKAVARNIARSLDGLEPRTFRYTPMGQLALVGRRAGVADVLGVRLSGMPAWAMWRAVYLYKAPSWTERARVAVDWTLGAAFGREFAGLPSASEAASGGAFKAATGAVKDPAKETAVPEPRS